ncbi:MAG TPA: hypothetical protein VN577_20610 [Terriglobales bacterium]|nr:hypothetical protein [Terriglobales bacterium]
MKSIKYVCLAVLLSTVMLAQAPASKPAANTDVYHVHFTKAALGKAAELGRALATVDSSAPMPGHFIVLRHQEGDEWDYVVIEHLGTKATVDASPSTTPPSVRDLSAWHGDTFVAGPSWKDFTREMGIGENASKTANAVYIVSTYRAAPGHRDQLEKTLSPVAGGKIETGNVMMQHLEGGPWNFLTLTRYNSWQDLASDRSAPSNADGWNQTRENATFHRDTIADRVFPK